MGNSAQHPALRLDKSLHRCCLGTDGVDGSVRLEGDCGPDAPSRHARVSDRLSEVAGSFATFERDVLSATAFAAMASDTLGFRLEFNVVGPKAPALWLQSMTLVRVRQIFAHAEAPPRVTSVRGFYALSFIVRDLYDADNAGRAQSERRRKDREAARARRRAARAQADASRLTQLTGLDDKAFDAQEPVCSAPCVEEGLDFHHQEQGQEVHEQQQLQRQEQQQQQQLELELDDLYEEEEEDDDECPICLEHRVEVVPPCGHGLCRGCFRGWHAKSRACPTCRADGHENEVFIVDDDRETLSVVLTHVNDLVKSVHAIVQSLPMLETDWERAQRNRARLAANRRASSGSASSRSSFGSRPASLRSSGSSSEWSWRSSLSPSSQSSRSSPASPASTGGADQEPASASDFLRGAAGAYDSAAQVAGDFADASPEELAHIRLAIALSIADLGDTAQR
jgi:hypothetical protein